MYFWTTANYFEPCYSRDRIVQAKLIMILTIIDDAYGTLEELQSFTDALERWDTHATGDLPDYMKTLYSVILNLFGELNNYVSEEGRSYSVSITRDKLKEYVRACLVEAKWLNEGFVPSFNQRLSNAIITAGPAFILAASFLGMGARNCRDQRI
ncbi:hypothetical protein Pint_16599 [Pistacia integerrima]|uniref:Uncharacterized protein n=1 Tax=Pistacia integerrima TaxID=434235 RepID=A0ACC0ZAL8_9ROSI|nr:hypothetical protein Pint_16599 [Pistacia integerrima]